jgi:hypothetical protein
MWVEVNVPREELRVVARAVIQDREGGVEGQATLLGIGRPIEVNGHRSELRARVA